MREGFIVILLAWYLKGVSTVRDYSVDRLSLEGPGEAQLVANPLPQVEEEAEAGANYVDCLRRWEEERQRQLAFMEGFTHLVSAQRRVQRLHVSMRGFGHGRNLTVLVSDLQQRLSLLSRAGLRYAERLKLHVDQLHPQLSERCKNSTLDVEDLRNEILSAVSSRRRAGTLKKLKADVQQQTMEDEQKRLVAAAAPEAELKPTLLGDKFATKMAQEVKSATPVANTSPTNANLQNAVPVATNEHFLPRFCDVLRPPHGIESATAICHYVGCFPYMENKSEDTVSTPNFFCALRKGKILEHALLHCSLLLGLSFKAYVCCGTNLRGDPHAWVAVFEEDGTVRFWEPFLGSGTLQLRRRFAHPQYLLPGRPARSLKDVDLLTEDRRRRRMLLQSRKNRTTFPQRLVLKASPEAVTAQAARATTKKTKKTTRGTTKKSIFRGGGNTEKESAAHEHDMVYVDVLDLGVKERPEEDRGENGAYGSCASCFAVVGGSYFYRGFTCPTCLQEGARYLLCYKCAEPLFNDMEELEDIDFSVRDRFNFEDYNAYMGESDSHQMLPYRSVEVVFNNANIWMNKQDPDPRYIFWDLQNSDYWHPFSNKVSGLRPCFSSCRFPMAGRDEGWCVQQRRELLQELRKTIQLHRSHKNLGTRWVTSPQLLRFLEAGLRIRAQLDMEGHIIEDEHPKEDLEAKHELQMQLEEWETTLHAKTPKEYKLSSMPMHFNFLDADEIAEKVMDLCPFLMTRDKSAQFAVACHLIPLPGEVVSIYLYACELHALSQMQLREEQERQDQPGDDRGVTVAQLMKKLKGANKEPQGPSLATMIIEAAKLAKNMDAPVVEAAPEEAVKKKKTAKAEAAEAGEQQPEEAAAVLTSWEPSFHSRYVRIDGDALEANYVATKDEEDYALHGGLIGNGPLPESDGGKYFEVEVTRTREGHPDGLCVGVTLTHPQELTEPPDTMDGIRDTWIAGYDGLFWDCLQADMLQIPWNPASLQNGDKVGVLIRPNGAFLVLVNGEVSVHLPSANVPIARPLFPVVDLLGSCDAVQLHPNAELPELGTLATEMMAPEMPRDTVPEAAASSEAPLAQRASVEERNMSAFDSKKKGHYVRLSEDGLIASYTGQTGHEMHGGLIGNAPLTQSPVGSVHFTVEVTKIRPKMMDGLTLGIARVGPKDVDEMTDTIDGIQACWTVGYDGQMYDGQEDRWMDLNWHGRDLNVGDKVTVQVTEAGQMKIFVNQAFMADAHAGIPCDQPLYALVDLIGSADGVKLLLDTPMPESDAAPSAPSGIPGRQVKPCKVSMEGWWHRHGSMVSLSENGLTASYASSVYELYGGVMGDGPLRSFDDCWFFAIRVESIRPGNCQEGLALGVTTCQPGVVEEIPQTMDEVDPCWLMGFDGVEWDGAGLTWGPSRWSPANLKVGDVVGVVVTVSGELQIVVNDAFVTQATFALPTERPLFAIVDLIGATTKVSYLPDAQPPSFKAAPSGLVFAPPVLREDPFTAPSEAGDLVAPEDVEFEDSPPASPQDPVVVEVPEVQVLVTEAPGPSVAPEEPAAAPKSPRDDALGAVLAAQVLATESTSGASPSTLAPSPGGTPASPGRSGPKRKPVKGAANKGVVSSTQKAGVSAEATVAVAPASPRGSRERRTPTRHASAARPATPAAPAAQVGFHATKHGRFVTLSSDGLYAKHVAPFEDDMFGGVLGNIPLVKEPSGHYFEVKIEEATTGMPDGLAIGVTTVNPTTLKHVPEILDGLGQAWLVGFDGIMYDANDFSEVDWYPSELRIGDRVGVLVTPEGQLQIFVNGKWRLDGPKNVDISRPLFLALDLIGNTEAVSLVPQARCPAAAGGGGNRASANPKTGLRGFHRQSLGRQLRLLGEWTVEHMGKEELQGTALGAAPLEFSETKERYFEVHIDEVIQGRPDGMAIGVTSHRPEEILDPPVSSDALRPAWLVGFDGAVWDGAKMEWLLSDWDTRQLAVGDAVGATVDSQGTLRIFVNGRQVAKGPNIQTQAALYPMVDLLGTVKRVSLLPVASPPAISEELWTPPGPSVPDTTMSCFHREKVGHQILLSEDGTSAQRATYTQSAWDAGLVFGDAPLPPREDGAVGFTLLITSSVAPGDTEALALGVTSRPPNELTNLPATADEVDPSYLLGFDGAAWDGSALKWHFSHWQPQTLKANDRVDVVLEKQRLQVAVNGTRVAAQAMQVSNPQQSFYALIDLASAGMAVQLQDVKAVHIGEELAKLERGDRKSVV